MLSSSQGKKRSNKDLAIGAAYVLLAGPPALVVLGFMCRLAWIFISWGFNLL